MPWRLEAARLSGATRKLVWACLAAASVAARAEAQLPISNRSDTSPAPVIEPLPPVEPVGQPNSTPAATSTIVPATYDGNSVLPGYEQLARRLEQAEAELSEL